MRETSDTYKTLRTQTGSYYEVEVLRGGRVYTTEDLISININPKLFEGSGPSIGNAMSSLCYMTIIESSENWPRMAEFAVRIRLCSEDGLTKTDWLSMGIYYTDTRKETRNGYLQITGYDCMLMTEQYWSDLVPEEELPSEWPITSRAWLNLIESTALYAGGNLLSHFADFPTSGGYPLVSLTWNLDKTQATVTCNTEANYFNYIGIYDPLDWEMPSVLEYDTLYKIQYSTSDPNVKLRITVNGEATDYTGDAFLTVPEGGDFTIELKIEKNCAVDATIYLAMPQKIEIDSRTIVDNTVPLIGLDTTSTIRDVLKTIASANGGNWIVTFDGKLRLVPFVNDSPSDNPAIAGIGIAGIAIVGSTGGGISPSGIGSTNLGFNVHSFETSPALQPITGVHLFSLIGASLDAGTASGYVLNGFCNYSASEGVAPLCLSKTNGYVYKPFTAMQASLDPAAEPGDIVIIDSVEYQIMDTDWNICTWPTALLQAPYEEEINHEFTYFDESAKYYRKTVKETEEKLQEYPTREDAASMISQSADDILLNVGETYYTQDEVDEIQLTNESNFQLTAQQIQAALSQIATVNGEVEEIHYYIRYEVISGVGTVIVGQTNSLAELHITNNQISLMYNGDVISYWNQNKQYTPKQLEIPNGGSLRIGNLLVQPRSSGNVSVMWLGES